MYLVKRVQLYLQVESALSKALRKYKQLVLWEKYHKGNRTLKDLRVPSNWCVDVWRALIVLSITVRVTWVKCHNIY